ncbi:YbjN domain-containing protein [Hymenobacter sp. BT770]|uniref:YbjN domain-containing protein n=1 Tax=Hymenobacter sp. BT770 TaxID=2886942 RepID=UPI001D1045C4|nr:YbjN domain-containing protein [Hymenobacter sp. BT770]MCC3155513.1 YbjN domain-containing protein [Hymenobacter sp. BT770]MDO3417519.1 YbjN domain-containing protein [Hymenobacter sp. BT770]
MTHPYFATVHGYLLELGFDICHADAQEGVLVVDKPELAIRNLVIGCGDPLLILEQYLLDLPAPSLAVYQRLLQKNRDIIHGAFALDDSGRKLIFRDTLQIDSLDLAELDACVNSLGLLLSEFADELIQFSKPLPA